MLEPNCHPVSPCKPCPISERHSACEKTGFVQELKCAHVAGNATDGRSHMAEMISCEPPKESWKSVVAFDFIMFLGVVVSLAVVRTRKQLARQNLVTLVNRS